MSYGNYTALLVRRNKTVRVLAAGVSQDEALASINGNWQNRNHPENVHNYILVSGSGGASVAQVVDPAGKAVSHYSAPPTTKRPAIV
jgi:hypothetical protein